MRKTCINGKVVGGLALAGLVVFAVAPSLIGAALALLVLAACPLSMVVMMRTMQGRRGQGAPGSAAGAAECDGEGQAAERAQLRAEVDQLRAAPAQDSDAPGRSAATG